MRTLLLLGLATVMGCGDGGSKNDLSVSFDLAMNVDLSGHDQASGMCNADLGGKSPSACGHPCDTGNSIGIGKYCGDDPKDCMGNGQAQTCSSILNMGGPLDTYFCTLAATCTPGGANICAENAHCQCMAPSGLCGCVPDRCMLPQG